MSRPGHNSQSSFNALQPAYGGLPHTDISSNHLSLLAWVLRRKGMDVDAIFEAAGAYIPNTITPLERVPLAAVVRILRLVQVQAGDPCAALNVYQSMKLMHFDVLGVALSCSTTLMELFERAGRYCSYIGPAFTLEVETDEASSIIIGKFNAPLVENIESRADDAQLLMQCLAHASIRILNDLYDAPVPIEHVYLAGEPDDKIVQAFAQASSAPVTTGASFIGARIKNAVMYAPLPGQNPTLARDSDRKLTSQLAVIDSDDILRQCERLLTEGIALGEVSLKRIAQQLGTSESSLRRKLLKRGISFSDLLTGMKKSLAEQYLCEGNMRVSDIAFALGFDSPSNFSRAFRAWTGQSPREYRSRKRPLQLAE